MTFDQTMALVVLLATVAGLVWGRMRSDVVALSAAAALFGLGVVRPAEVQSAFASPALITLASMFVIAYAMELAGVLDALIGLAIGLCRRLGQAGMWILLFFCGGLSGFLNNTPIVVIAAPVVRDASRSLGLSARRFLIPLSYITVLGGCTTLIGTSTNLLVNDMARSGGHPGFGLFDVLPVALAMAAVGAAYLLVAAPLMLGRGALPEEAPRATAAEQAAADRHDGAVGDPAVFAERRPFDPRRGFISIAVFAAVIGVATSGLLTIAAASFTGAVALILLGAISPDDAYRGLRPQILLLIVGMVVVGLSLEVTGLADSAARSVLGLITRLGPALSLALLYGVTLLLTEILSNAAVAVLMTPIAVSVAESLGVSSNPFLVAVMMAASAAFATPFGYQTHVLVYEMGRYSYMDFVRIGVPLDLLTWATAVVAIPMFFPF